MGYWSSLAPKDIVAALAESEAVRTGGCASIA